MGNNYVLAMYDIRGKQEYIYRSNRLKEIVGGSAVIKDCFKDYLYPAAIKYRNYIYHYLDDNKSEAIFNYTSKDKLNNEKEFKEEIFKERMCGKQYIGEVVYDGGGNFIVLYKDAETCREINKIFTKNVMETTYSLKVLCTFVDNINFNDYEYDRKRLYQKHSMREARETTEIPAQVLPFTQIDLQTSMPLYKSYTVQKYPNKREIPLSKENFCKYKKYWEVEKEQRKEFGEVNFDNIITEKGEESLLAVVYIDGNNMGAKVIECLGKSKSYDECIKNLRDFSESIQKDYVDNRMKDIEKMLDDKYGSDDKKHRFIVYAGDEINFVCNARDAYAITKTYIEGLPKGCSVCAGISIFHSHAPYSEAYRIAEECCKTGKSKMKKLNLDNVSLLDVHYCQSGIGIDLETIRQIETNSNTSKPWFLTPPENIRDYYVTTDMVEAMANELNKIARTNIKSLAEHAKNSISNLKMELKRIIAHSNKNTQKPDFYLENLLGENKLNDEKMSILIYDIIILYDLWFFKDDNEGSTVNAGKY